MYALYDTPHLLKSIRNTVKKHDVVFANGEKVFFYIIIRLKVMLLFLLQCSHSVDFKVSISIGLGLDDSMSLE